MGNLRRALKIGPRRAVTSSRLVAGMIIAVVAIGGAVILFVGGASHVSPSISSASSTSLPSSITSQTSSTTAALGTAEVFDPKGDVGSSPAYLDIVGARIVSLPNRSLMFQVVVADQIPTQPSGFIAYAWFLTSGVTKVSTPAIALIYDNQTQKWNGLILNATGGDVPGQGKPPQTSMTGLTFAISGSDASVIAPLDVLGNPTSLTWHSVSRSSPFGGGVRHVDKAPDQGDANWPGSLSSASLTTSTTRASSTSAPITKSIVNGLVTVQAGGYQGYQFVVPNGTTSARLVGNFSVQGGNGGILVIVLDPTNYAKFQNSQQSARIYDSGQVAASSINQTLSSGTYYLVFADKFDPANAKTVSAQINLVYSS